MKVSETITGEPTTLGDGNAPISLIHATIEKILTTQEAIDRLQSLCDSLVLLEGKGGSN